MSGDGIAARKKAADVLGEQYDCNGADIVNEAIESWRRSFDIDGGKHLEYAALIAVALADRVEAAERRRDYWNADRNKIAGEYQDLILRLTRIGGALFDAGAPVSAGEDEPLWSDEKRIRLLGEARVAAEARVSELEEAARRSIEIAENMGIAAPNACGRIAVTLSAALSSPPPTETPHE